MNDSDRATATMAAFAVGAAALAAAAAVSLLRRTRGLPTGRRAGAMAELAATAAWTALPPRRGVASVSTGLLAFAASLSAGLAVTLLVIWLIPPTVPHPTEANEGFGDAVTALFRFATGAVLSLFVALFVGLFAAERVASRWGAGGEQRRV